MAENYRGFPVEVSLFSLNGALRCGMKIAGKCCNDYEIPNNFVKLIGNKESYQSETDDNGTDGNDSSEDDLII